MDFDKKTIIGLLLIGLVIVFTNTDLYKKLVFGEQYVEQQRLAEQQKGQTESGRDVLVDSLELTPPVKTMKEPVAETQESIRAADVDNILLRNLINDYQLEVPVRDERIITIDAPDYIGKISTRGPSIVSWTLKNYLGPDSLPVQLINDSYENFYLSFPVDGDSLHLADFVYDVDSPVDRLQLSESNPSQSIVLQLDLGQGRTVQQTFTFHFDSYSFDLNIDIQNFEKFVDGLTYSLVLGSGLNSTEHDFANDMSRTKGYARAGDEIEEYDVSDEESGSKELIDWTINWAAVRTKYFTSALIARSQSGKGVIFRGKTQSGEGDALFKKYDVELLMPFSRRGTSDAFTVYLGPLKYSVLQSYDVGLEDMMSLGPTFIRFLGKIVLWSITHLYSIIPNYGWVIIVFSILVKLLLHPLTKKSYQSMKEMQKVQPLMQELREKYKDNPQKMNQEVMKLYKEHSVNPLGGCLPMLLQLPLLYALFEVFRTTIEFRGAPFIGWITDLSGPDTLMTIPGLGVPLNVLPLVMGITMFLQQKSTMTDPKQKALIYMMPGLMTFFFYSFPSGLNLYYTLFNLLTIAHQRMISTDSKDNQGKNNNTPTATVAKKATSKRRLSRLDMMRQISKKK